MNPDYVEIDCKWFDPTWLLDHPDFPLAPSGGDSRNKEPDTEDAA